MFPDRVLKSSWFASFRDSASDDVDTEVAIFRRHSVDTFAVFDVVVVVVVVLIVVAHSVGGGGVCGVSNKHCVLCVDCLERVVCG